MRIVISSNLKQIKDRLQECAALFAFEYKGYPCDVDPFNPNLFHVYCDGEETDVYSIEDVMNKPLFKGKSLAEIADEIRITDW